MSPSHKTFLPSVKNVKHKSIVITYFCQNSVTKLKKKNRIRLTQVTLVGITLLPEIILVGCQSE